MKDSDSISGTNTRRFSSLIRVQPNIDSRLGMILIAACLMSACSKIQSSPVSQKPLEKDASRILVTTPGFAAVPLDRKSVRATFNQIAQVAANRTDQDVPAADYSSANHDKKYQPLFVGWSKPTVTLMITGRQHGYIEPCGCTGLTNQKGGLSRRHTLLKQMQDKGWDVIPIDAGNQVRRFGRQPEIKFQSTVDSLRTMQYRYVSFGPDDLRLSIGELIAAVAPRSDDEPSMFVCSNANLFEFNDKFRVIETNGKKIGITSVIGSAEMARINNDEIEIAPPSEALQSMVEPLKEAKCDVRILVAYASIEESKQLAISFPLFHLVITAGGQGEPTRRPQEIDGTRTKMIQVGKKGMYVGVVGIFGESRLSMRYQRVPLDARFPDSRPMLDALATYQQQLEAEGLEGLGLKPLNHPTHGTQRYVGSQACGDCHTKAFAKWKKTPHFHATIDIAEPGERSEIYRHFDPECLSCHVTGWDPQGYFPYKSGYVDYKKSQALHGVGCENCHGPGSDHLAVESGDREATEAEVEALRAKMRINIEHAQDHHCGRCHDLDNSPDFEFEEYWDKVKHYGTD